jgi:hypothetical protein
MSHEEIIDAAIRNLTSEGAPLGWAMPGPLDGHARPLMRVDQSLPEDLLQEMSTDASGSISSRMAYFSQLFDLGEKILAQACQTIGTSIAGVAEADKRPDLLLDIGIIAAAHRSKDLARSIAEIALKRTPFATTDKAVIYQRTFT